MAMVLGCSRSETRTPNSQCYIGSDKSIGYAAIHNEYANILYADGHAAAPVQEKYAEQIRRVWQDAHMTEPRVFAFRKEAWQPF